MHDAARGETAAAGEVCEHRGAEHQKFIRWATKGARSARVCLEATGIYSLEFALALHHAKNVEVRVVNPRAIKDFGRAPPAQGRTRPITIVSLRPTPAIRVRKCAHRE
jgi:transposase